MRKLINWIFADILKELREINRKLGILVKSQRQLGISQPFSSTEIPSFSGICSFAPLEPLQPITGKINTGGKQ